MNQPPAPDARWRPVLALLLVGLTTAGLATLCPTEGWTVAGTTVRLKLPASFSALLTPSTDKPVVPRWKPEDVEDLLAAYDAQLDESEASAVAADTLFTSAPSDSGMAAATPLSAAVHPSNADSTAAAGPAALAPSPTSTAASEASADVANVALPVTPSMQPPSADGRENNSRTEAKASAWIPGALRVRIPEDQPQMFDRLWQRLQRGEDVHVLHYGDSQIEGDRISGTLRSRWQERWGGFGPGIQPPIPLVQSFALRQSSEGAWKRHTRFGRRDTTDADENYGLLASYADAEGGVEVDEPLCLRLGREPRSPRGFGMWTNVEMWHDTVHTPCTLQMNGTVVDTLLAGDPPGIVAWPGSAMMPQDADLELCFSATPPRLFALHPVGGGVQWHGVAMRGSSGTLFRKLDRGVFADQLDRLSPDLVVLQFGGNSVPHCRDSAAAVRYAGWIQRQIQLFQSLEPQAAILVIGPSDMAEKTGVDWTSYPMLSPIRDALLEASLNAGAAYWDLLEVMGGLGSMPAWVQAEPPLAGPDHIHFTPRGARKVGELLDRALWAEFRRWEQGEATPEIQSMRPKSAGHLPVQTGLQHAP